MADCAWTDEAFQKRTESDLNLLYASLDTQFLTHRSLWMEQLESLATLWNSLLLKKRPLRFYLDQNDRTYEAHQLIDSLTTQLNLLDRNVEESLKKSEDRPGRQLVEKYLAELGELASKKKRAYELILRCAAEPIQAAIDRERPEYLLLNQAIERTLIAELTALHSRHARNLQMQQDTLNGKWTQMRERGNEIAQKSIA